jgi:integrase
MRHHATIYSVRALVRIKKWDSQPDLKYVVVYRQGGKRQARYFRDQKNAREFANQKQVELINEGRKHGEITDEERRAVLAARELEEHLSESGITGFALKDAVDHYSAHLKALATSRTVQKAAEELIELREVEGKSRAHVADLRLRLLRFAQAHKGRLAASITTVDVNVWLLGIKCGPQTRKNYRGAVHNLFSFCVSQGYAASNPVTQAARVKVPPAQIGILNVSEAHHLLLACPQGILPAAAIGLFAGLRREEIARLDWKEINLDRGYIEVKAAKSKTARRRLVEISGNLRAWLTPRRKLAGPVSPTPSTYRRRFAETVKAAGIQKWPSNALRHSFASYHLAFHQNAAATALQLGHANSRLLFEHYRELVHPEDAKTFWQIVPDEEDSGKVIPLERKLA